MHRVCRVCRRAAPSAPKHNIRCRRCRHTSPQVWGMHLERSRARWVDGQDGQSRSASSMGLLDEVIGRPASGPPCTCASISVLRREEKKRCRSSSRHQGQVPTSQTKTHSEKKVQHMVQAIYLETEARNKEVRGWFVIINRYLKYKL